MSRHRDVRCMNYSDEYEGYDDVYGHSVEDDYCVSPSAEQFLFDRNKKQNISSFFTEPDIAEDNEEGEESSVSHLRKKDDLSELEMAKLISCMESIRNVIGDTVSESKLTEKIIEYDFDAEATLDAVLKDSSPTDRQATNKERLDSRPDVSINKNNTVPFVIPKISFNKPRNAVGEGSGTSVTKRFENLTLQKNSPQSTTFTSLSQLIKNLNNENSPNAQNVPGASSSPKPFNRLADLTAHHLQKTNNFEKESRAKTFSPNNQFVIPKLSFKKSPDQNSFDTTKSPLINFNDSKTSENKNRVMHLEENPFQSKIHVDACRDSNIISEKVKDTLKEKRSVDIMDNVKNESAGDCLIDLTKALKESLETKNGISNSDKLPKVHTLFSKNFDDDIKYPDTYTQDNKKEVSAAKEKCVLDLKDLNDIKLPYTKDTVSMFGKTLCKNWNRIRKPMIIPKKQQYGKIKRFDFSSPYSPR